MPRTVPSWTKPISKRRRNGSMPSRSSAMKKFGMAARMAGRASSGARSRIENTGPRSAARARLASHGCGPTAPIAPDQPRATTSPSASVNVEAP